MARAGGPVAAWLRRVYGLFWCRAGMGQLALAFTDPDPVCARQPPVPASC